MSVSTTDYVEAVRQAVSCLPEDEGVVRLKTLDNGLNLSIDDRGLLLSLALFRKHYSTAQILLDHGLISIKDRGWAVTYIVDEDLKSDDLENPLLLQLAVIRQLVLEKLLSSGSIPFADQAWAIASARRQHNKELVDLLGTAACCPNPPPDPNVEIFRPFFSAPPPKKEETPYHLSLVKRAEMFEKPVHWPLKRPLDNSIQLKLVTGL
jgi:hypothetical protein